METELLSIYNFNILFNNKETINSELDIFIPSLSLAFEINGILHYKPIYGKDKLKQIKANDLKKKHLCKSKNIALKTIDISEIHHFSPSKVKKYLDRIINTIEKLS